MCEQVQSISQLLTIKQFCARHPWPTEPALRWLIFRAAENGFHRVIRRVGRRVLLDESEFFIWVAAQQDDHQGASS